MSVANNHHALSHPTIALVGNPNCGKTTLFNALTGTWQQVGNWSGVTVERKAGFFQIDQQNIEVIDLPGTYTLTMIDPQGPQDENLTAEFLKSKQFSAILNIIDATNLERNLYLTLQCLEQDVPVVIALNRIDLVEKHEAICIQSLMTHLGCQVIPIAARQGKGIDKLKQQLAHSVSPTSSPVSYPAVIQKQVDELQKHYQALTGKVISQYQLLCWLEGEPIPCHSLLTEKIQAAQKQIQKESGQAADILIAKARYDFIEELMIQCKGSSQETDSKKREEPQRFTRLFDKIVCHRYLGLPFFLGTMYALFFFAIKIGGAFQDFFELSAQAIFVKSLGSLLHDLGVPSWLMALLVSGLGEGITTIITFVPVIGAMFLALAFLEDSGYMARAAFVIDRIMQAVGLPGKSFVPMIIGFGCNVPAIMGARTLDNKRDRILAVMMSPFMSCGARLAIFTIFAAAFFPKDGQNVVFLLYLIGIAMAVLTGLLLKKTILRGENSPLLLEMPDYQWPHWQSLWFHCWHRLKRFIFNAGKLILPICIAIGVLNSISVQGKWLEEPNESSLLSVVGQTIVPLFEPIGVEKENWPAAVGLLTGVLAKEVVIGTLNSLYAQESQSEEEPEYSLKDNLKIALATIPQNLGQLAQAWQNPIAVSPPEMTTRSYGEMVRRFQGQANAFAYLLFVLLYFPCVSATAAMAREVQKGWTLFSVCWTTGLAYMAALVYYQCATFTEHPLQSSAWIVFCLVTGMITFLGIRHYGRIHLPKILPTPIILK